MSGYISGRSSITTIQTGNIAADAVTSAKVADDVIDSEHYTDGSIDTAHIADDQITLAKMASGTDGNIITYDASGNPAAVATGSNGQVLTSAGAGAAPTFVTAAGASDAEAANIMLNAFRISVNGGLSVQNMVDGVVDEFEDETGVDTSTSTDENYDATNDLYNNSSDYTTDVTGSGTATADSSMYDLTGAHIFDNSTSTRPSWNAGYPDWLTYDFGSGNDKTITKMTVQQGTDGTTYGATHWTLQGSSDNATWTTIDTQSGITWSADFEIQTFTFENSTAYRYIRWYITNGIEGTYCSVAEVEYMEDGPAANMTLVSNASTALAAPDDANVVIWQEDVDSVTLNTDLKAYASRDGGTTFTQTTLAKEASLPGIDVSTLIAQASGTVIGNATQNGGLAAAFDGTTSQDWSASARKDPSSNITVGKDWGSGVTKKVARFKAWAPNNYTFGNAGTMKLQGSTDNFSSSIVDLWSGSYSATTAETKDISTGIDTSTAYRYHRLYCTGGSGGGAFAEIEFYKDVTSPSTNILTGSADISGQPSGTSMKYKIETLNTKKQKIHAVALQWS